ncbi:hypothetical protein WAJ73_20365, partial [Acinetobacter baumannii]
MLRVFGRYLQPFSVSKRAYRVILAENLEDSKVKKIDSTHMQAAQLLGSICSDQKGTPFFSS